MNHRRSGMELRYHKKNDNDLIVNPVRAGQFNSSQTSILRADRQESRA